MSGASIFNVIDNVISPHWLIHQYSPPRGALYRYTFIWRITQSSRWRLSKFLEAIMAEGFGLEEAPKSRTRRIWQLVHHLIAHPLIGFTGGRLWAWRFHDWTLPKAWPNQKHEIVKRRAGLE